MTPLQPISVAIAKVVAIAIASLSLSTMSIGATLPPLQDIPCTRYANSKYLKLLAYFPEKRHMECSVFQTLTLVQQRLFESESFGGDSGRGSDRFRVGYPCSTFKVALALMAIDNGLIQNEDTEFCLGWER